MGSGLLTSSYVYNNTVYNIKETKTGSPWGAAWGIAAFARIDCTNCNVWVYAKNNYVGDVVANLDYEACYDQVNSGAILYQTTNVSSDGRGTLGLRNKDQYSTYFVSIANGSEDLHLRNDSNTLWGSYGADLDNDPNLPITTDVDGEARNVSAPDIGADELLPDHFYYRRPSPSIILREGQVAEVRSTFQI